MDLCTPHISALGCRLLLLLGCVQRHLVDCFGRCGIPASIETQKTSKGEFTVFSRANRPDGTGSVTTHAIIACSMYDAHDCLAEALMNARHDSDATVSVQALDSGQVPTAGSSPSAGPDLHPSPLPAICHKSTRVGLGPKVAVCDLCQQDGALGP